MGMGSTQSGEEISNPVWFHPETKKEIADLGMLVDGFSAMRDWCGHRHGRRIRTWRKGVCIRSQKKLRERQQKFEGIVCYSIER